MLKPLGRKGKRRICADCGKKRATRIVFVGRYLRLIWLCLKCYDANGAC